MSSKVSIHPVAWFFFLTAIVAAIFGIASGFEHKFMNIAVVVGNALGGLLAQWGIEKGYLL
jgi:hypothetical protein